MMALRGPTLCATRFNEMPHVDVDRDDVIFGVDEDDYDDDNNDDDDDGHQKMPTTCHDTDLSNISM